MVTSQKICKKCLCLTPEGINCLPDKPFAKWLPSKLRHGIYGSESNKTCWDHIKSVPKGQEVIAAAYLPLGSVYFSRWREQGLTCSSSSRCACSSGTGCRRPAASRRRRWSGTGCSAQICRIHPSPLAHPARWPHGHLPG